LPKQSRRQRRRTRQSADPAVSTPIQSDPPLAIPGITGDVVADYGAPVAVEEPVAAEPEPVPEQTRFRGRYMAERQATTESTTIPRRRTPDHRYVIGELKRIAIIAVLMLAILAIATIVLR
jgi:hypothetical protein